MASQSVVSGHSQVEASVTDVSLHAVDRLSRRGTQEVWVKQFDDVYKLKTDAFKTTTGSELIGNTDCTVDTLLAKVMTS